MVAGYNAMLNGELVEMGFVRTGELYTYHNIVVECKFYNWTITVNGNNRSYKVTEEYDHMMKLIKRYLYIRKINKK